MSQDVDVFAIFSARRRSAAGGCYNNDVRWALKRNLFTPALHSCCVCLCLSVYRTSCFFGGLIPFSGSFRLSCTSHGNMFTDLLLYEKL